MKKITYEVWARPTQNISAETIRLFNWYKEMATQLKLEAVILNNSKYITLAIYIKTDDDMKSYDTLYREYICHPERSEYYE